VNEDQRYLVDKRALRRSFSAAAESYDALAIVQREVLGRMMERLDLIRYRPREILDVGCGTGESFRRLRARYPRSRVTGVDIAPGMLGVLRRRDGWLRRPRLVAADVEALPFVDRSFDAVFSNLTLQWVNDLDGALREMNRVLRPGGLLMFSTLGPDTLGELRQAWASSDGYTHVNAFIDMHDVGDAMLRVGVVDPVLDCERLTVAYRDVDALMADLKGMGARNVTAGRPRGLGGRARLSQLRQAYERHRDPEGRLPATWELVYGHGWGGPRAKAATRPNATGTVQIDLDRLRP
jgi:malonyl-CoA O-methyltransferase